MHEYWKEVGSFLWAFLKVTGLKAMLGAAGACALYMAMPPVNKDGTFNRREFFYRMTTAVIFSVVFGEWFATIVITEFPRLLLANHKEVIYPIVGAPAWWITRLVAITLRKREGKDVVAIWTEFKGR